MAKISLISFIINFELKNMPNLAILYYSHGLLLSKVSLLKNLFKLDNLNNMCELN
jgi:hypothetical protein